MKKAVLLCVFFLSAAPLLRAQEPLNQNPGDLKDMAVSQIYEYGQTLYERHDYEEAGHVLRHLLQLKPGYAPALELLRRMNEPAPQSLSWQQLPLPPLNTNFSGPNADLQKEIAVETQAISRENQELAHIHTTKKAYEND